jgi:hypothetical protein
MEGVFKHVDGSQVKDYHEFKHAHEEYIEERSLYRLPNYVSITNGILASNDTMIVSTITITYNNDSTKWKWEC